MRVLAPGVRQAVHREFIAEHQPWVVYDGGPTFSFESCSIFDAFQFRHHLDQAPDCTEARARRLNELLNDATLEQSPRHSGRLRAQPVSVREWEVIWNELTRCAPCSAPSTRLTP